MNKKSPEPAVPSDLVLANAVVQRVKAGTMNEGALALISAALISRGAEPAVDKAGNVIVPACSGCRWCRVGLPCKKLHIDVKPDFFCKLFELRRKTDV